ncbi:MAG: biopolymer transporter ExbD [Pseudomonadota bacterium]
MRFQYRHKPEDEAELDVTAFLNLMIVLVPVLLLTMTFTQVTVLEIKLPELTGGTLNSEDTQSTLEVLITEKGIRVIYPENVVVQNIPATVGQNGELEYDFDRLSLVMQALKKQLNDKKDAVVRASPNVGYQHLVSTMDAVKSFKTVVVTSLEEFELFPDISLGDVTE